MSFTTGSHAEGRMSENKLQKAPRRSREHHPNHQATRRGVAGTSAPPGARVAGHPRQQDRRHLGRHDRGSQHALDPVVRRPGPATRPSPGRLLAGAGQRELTGLSPSTRKVPVDTGIRASRIHQRRAGDFPRRTARAPRTGPPQKTRTKKSPEPCGSGDLILWQMRDSNPVGVAS